MQGDMDADDPDDASPPTKCAKAAEDADYKARVKNILKDKSDLFEDMVEGQSDIRLGDEGWKARYYEQKFGIADEEAQQELIADLRRNYVEGLCWVMRYYFDGVASWRWFYRYHYAPFASDLAGMGSLQVQFYAFHQSNLIYQYEMWTSCLCDFAVS
jgi:5'-3' exoribonuclease 2